MSLEEKSDNKSELLSGFISDLQFEHDMHNVRLRWEPETKPLLNNNFELAPERFEELKRRFRNNSQFFEEYKKEGIIEKVKSDATPPNSNGAEC